MEGGPGDEDKKRSMVSIMVAMAQGSKLKFSVLFPNRFALRKSRFCFYVLQLMEKEVRE